MKTLIRGLGVALAVALVQACGGSDDTAERAAPPAQTTTTVAAAPAPPQAEPAATPSPAPAGDGFSRQQIEVLVAPIALFPDTLVAQVLAAATYPLEVVEASRWVDAHSDVKGDARDAALQDEDWDSSVLSLTSFPSVLDKMSENLDWTKDMGDAFLEQPEDVLDSVQRLRLAAQQAGTLKTTEQQTVVVEKVSEKEVVTVVPAEPDVVYVPQYNPSTAYGSGWAPPPQQNYGYGPMYQDPWGSVLTHGLAFGAGVAVGGMIWGMDWDDDDDIHIHNDYNGGGGGKKNVNVNKNVNIGEVNVGNKQSNRQNWQHKPEHRRGVNYRNQETANRVRERTGDRSGQQARADTRDRPGQRPAAGADRPGQRPAAGADRPAQARAGLDQRQQAQGAAGRGGDRPRSSQNVARGYGPSGGKGSGTTRPPAKQQAAARPSQPHAQQPRGGGQRQSTAFGGGGRSGSYERAASARGASSRGAQHGGGGYGGGGRGGGGGGRGGGGRGR